MPVLILHHYPMSPFSEKVRAVLGFKKLAWKSMLIPTVIPKPDLLALTGGYRKTPVLQVGADMYCDTALICDVGELVAATRTRYTLRRVDPRAGVVRVHFPRIDYALKQELAT